MCSLQFTGCTKDEATIESEAAATEAKAELILLNDKYVDEYGNAGRLYANPDNPSQILFDIVILAGSDSKELCNPNATGTLDDIGARGVVEYVCTGEAKNCWHGDKVIYSCPGTIDALKKR
jgi:hypothetical protein